MNAAADIEDDNSEQKLRDEYTDRIRTVTIAELPDFIAGLMNRQHDYGTICVALGIAAAGTAWACNKHDNGGITGFQAGAVFWEFAKAWGSPSLGETGARILQYDNLLFPQYDHVFTKISQSTFDRIKAAAEKKLAERDDERTAASVIAHWQSIAAGNVPFGLGIEA